LKERGCNVTSATYRSLPATYRSPTENLLPTFQESSENLPASFREVLGDAHGQDVEMLDKAYNALERLETLGLVLTG